MISGGDKNSLLSEDSVGKQAFRVKVKETTRRGMKSASPSTEDGSSTGVMYFTLWVQVAERFDVTQRVKRPYLGLDRQGGSLCLL